jgi:uncharacterized membrane protein YfcA
MSTGRRYHSSGFGRVNWNWQAIAVAVTGMATLALLGAAIALPGTMMTMKAQQREQRQGDETLRLDLVFGHFDHQHRGLTTLMDETYEFPPLFPLQAKDYVGFGMAIAALMLAAGGGMGGGGILLPLYILVLGFPQKHAIPLSGVTVFGGAIANNIFNSFKRHPNHPTRSCIDWDLVLQMEPMTIAGALVGVSLNRFLPGIAIVVLLLALLTATAYEMLVKAHKMYRKESEALLRAAENCNNEIESLVLGQKPPYMEAANTINGADLAYGATVATNGSPRPTDEKLELSEQEASADAHVKIQAWKDSTKLTCLIVVVTFVSLLKGGPDDIGGRRMMSLLNCSPTCFWISEIGLLLAIVLFACLNRASLLHRLRSGGPVCSDIAWDNRKTFTYPAMSIGAGVVAGLFGIGGGIVKAPLMLALGKFDRSMPVCLCAMRILRLFRICTLTSFGRCCHSAISVKVFTQLSLRQRPPV